MGPTVEISVRLGCFAGVLLVMATWEVWAPRRVLSVSKATRWSSNLGLVLLNNLAARWVMPLTAVAAAMLAESRGWGVLRLVEVLLNATAMFNHSNVRIPRQVERVLRWFIVTPDMHRVHHSVLRREMNSNFGFNVPWWDYWLGTYRDQPWDGHETMPLGLENLRDERQVERLPSILALPFTAPSAEKAEPDSSRGEKTGR